MKTKIVAIKRKEMPSKWGGTWTIAQVKLEGFSDKIFELSGYGSKQLENLKAGDSITGYVSQREWQGRDGVVVTPTFNKITAEYIYGELDRRGFFDGNTRGAANESKKIDYPEKDNWETGPAKTKEESEWETTVGEDDPGF